VLKLKYGTSKKPSGGIEKKSTRLKKQKNKYITLAKSQLAGLMAVDGQNNTNNANTMHVDNAAPQLNGFGARLQF
jgi:hypothetical protein